ncbi:uncharacterized protein LOC131940075 [Physella acuta]|uniref:uncharacterized protein LOC131940075 n=1 Tax=Physella acuta TaxID=109671 RepID=UPI0027DE1ED5|nr:uncharacterized protein LOC131940075 [Physella acuta]
MEKLLVLSALLLCVDCLEYEDTLFYNLVNKGWERKYSQCPDDIVCYTGYMTGIFVFPAYFDHNTVIDIKIFIMYCPQGWDCFPYYHWKPLCDMDIEYSSNYSLTCHRSKFPCWCISKKALESKLDDQMRLFWYPVHAKSNYSIFVEYKFEGNDTKNYLHRSPMKSDYLDPENEQFPKVNWEFELGRYSEEMRGCS